MQNNNNNTQKNACGDCVDVFEKHLQFVLIWNAWLSHTFWIHPANIRIKFARFMALHIINFRNKIHFLQYWNGFFCSIIYLAKWTISSQFFLRKVKPWNLLIDSKHTQKTTKQTNKHLKFDKLSSCEVAGQL